MSIMIIIALMSVVTFLPRILPAFIIDRIRLPIWIGQWLEFIPAAALGALIFPGVLNVVADKPQIGLIGGVVAIVLSLFRVHILVVVLGATTAVYFLL